MMFQDSVTFMNLTWVCDPFLAFFLFFLLTKISKLISIFFQILSLLIILDTMSWGEVETTGIPPSPCYGHSANYIGDNKIIYFGGKGFSVLNSVHIFETGACPKHFLYYFPLFQFFMVNN